MSRRGSSLEHSRSSRLLNGRNETVPPRGMPHGVGKGSARRCFVRIDRGTFHFPWSMPAARGTKTTDEHARQRCCPRRSEASCPAPPREGGRDPTRPQGKAHHEALYKRRPGAVDG